MKNPLTLAILDRVNQRLKALGMSARAASMKAEGNPDVIRNWKKNDKILPRVDTLINMAKALETTPEWLTYGATRHQSGAAGDDRIKSVKLISWVSAGAFTSNDPVTDSDETPTIDVADLPCGDWYALEVRGDSMDYISPPGSTIIVNRKDKELVGGACYVIQNDGNDATYKRFRNSPMRFEPYSHNPAHETIFVPSDGIIKVFGRVYRTITNVDRLD